MGSCALNILKQAAGKRPNHENSLAVFVNRYFVFLARRLSLMFCKIYLEIIFVIKGSHYYLFKFSIGTTALF